ncbi:hypothetical protein GCM10022210_49710 [Mucilaginibacter dorajii]|uniref:Family 43 glycosylhydrolase n=1 Tax=Mucilaginibacter dorajii TaxID=692994 RepID=A0ABP7QZ75_9SPHI
MWAQTDTIKPSAIWPDTHGGHIQAHGGGVIKVKDTYLWYGEQRTRDLDTAYRYVSCYASKNLVNWTFKGNALILTRPDQNLRNWVLERPKVFYNKKNKQYVMYMHIDGQMVDANGQVNTASGYSYARVGVAVSNRAEGPFKFIRTFRPLGYQSRDIGQFIDDDGSAYLIFEDRPNGFHIARLSDDYLDVEKDVCLIPEHMEGGAIVHYKGLYYCIGSLLTGWTPNPNKYATAISLAGPWSDFKDIAPPEQRTYGSQSTMLLKVEGAKQTTIIYMGDIWKPSAQWDSRYLWMPLHIGDGQLALPQPRPWTINVKTGQTNTSQPAGNTIQH